LNNIFNIYIRQWRSFLWKEILSQQGIRHFKILQSIYFAHDVGTISSYSNSGDPFVQIDIIVLGI